MLILHSHTVLMRLLMLSLIWSLLLCMTVLVGCSDSTASPVVKEENNFFVLAKEVQQKQVVLLLEFHSESCPYCIAVEEDFLKPMLLNQSYVPKVLIRKIQIDSGDTITDFNNQKVEARAFAKRYGVSFTPTLLFLDAQGNEVAEKIIGLNTPDFFGGYIDIEIEKALTKIRAKNAS